MLTQEEIKDIAMDEDYWTEGHYEMDLDRAISYNDREELKTLNTLYNARIAWLQETESEVK